MAGAKEAAGSAGGRGGCQPQNESRTPTNVWRSGSARFGAEAAHRVGVPHEVHVVGSTKV